MSTLSRRRWTPAEKVFVLAFLGVIALDDADAAEGLGKAPRDLRVELRALAEDRPDRPERLVQDDAEAHEEREGHERHRRADLEEDDERDRGREQSARELDEARPDEVSHALDVAHDPRDESARLVRVEVRDREPSDVRLDLSAQLRDETLRGLGQKLRQRERRDPLDERRRDDGAEERQEHLGASLADHVVDQELRRRRKDEPRDAVDRHEDHPEGEDPLARRHEGLDVRQQRREPLRFRRLRPFVPQLSPARSGFGRRPIGLFIAATRPLLP